MTDIPVDLKTLEIPREILREVDVRIALRYAVIPIGQKNGALQIMAPHEMSRQVAEEIGIILSRQIEWVPARREDIAALIGRFYGMGASAIKKLIRDRHEDMTPLDFVVIDQDPKEESPMIRLVNEMLLDALRNRASDIHIEPFDGFVRVRYRVDGILQEAQVSPEIRHVTSHLISRIKIMSRMDIGERRLPQDGRVKIKYGNVEIDLRISILPSSCGEAVVIRILKPLESLSLDELGFDEAGVRNIRKLLQRPGGMILVTGPTGSGKTTTLYACLKELNSLERKIITIEDPIEYRLSGILQIEVNPKIGLTFARALRSILRHDPDCVMVGEIRDKETAEIAIRAALTGHLVFSTLHTADAPSAVSRLLEMGIEPYLVASSVEAVIAQRLVRKICPPCDQCRGTGYYGRTVIYEWMILHEAIKNQVSEKKPGSDIRRLARQHGMACLWENGMNKVKQGVTDVEEIRRGLAIED
ncbi:MAG: GspE/PulE family protein [Candidatus Omnitrophica bacterium]|nr:GspE/PulE family protein [Candidatus Omnitrophota bacterium]